jgi:hypothetical protein
VTYSSLLSDSIPRSRSNSQTDKAGPDQAAALGEGRTRSARAMIPRGSTVRDIDEIIRRVTATLPQVEWEQLHVKHPGADDDGLWFFDHGERSAQIESSSGMCPFLIESMFSSDRFTADTVEAAVARLIDLLTLAPMRDAHEELRVHGGPDPTLRFEAVTVHPLADDAETLKRLGLDPSECKACDLYWVLNDALYFVAIASANESRPPLVMFRTHEGTRFRGSFFVVTAPKPITRGVVDAVLAWLERWMGRNGASMRVQKPELPVPVAQHDILARDG